MLYVIFLQTNSKFDIHWVDELSPLNILLSVWKNDNETYFNVLWYAKN